VCCGRVCAQAENLRLMLTLFRGHESAGILPCGPALACASAVFKRFIETRGAEIVAKLQAQRVLPDDAASAGAGTSAGAGKAPKAPKVKINDPEYVRELMRLLDVTTLLLRCFDNDVDFGRVAWRALESVLNSDRDHAEMIATFVDSALRGRIGTDKVDEAQIEAAVTGVLGLLRYLAVRRVTFVCGAPVGVGCWVHEAFAHVRVCVAGQGPVSRALLLAHVQAPHAAEVCVR
jgi:hypothetical protein